MKTVPQKFNDPYSDNGRFTVYPKYVDIEAKIEDGEKVNVYLSHRDIKQMYAAVIKEGGKY